MNDEEPPVYGEKDNPSCDASPLGRPRSLITACIFSCQETTSNTERVRGRGLPIARLGALPTLGPPVTGRSWTKSRASGGGARIPYVRIYRVDSLGNSDHVSS